MSTVEKENDPVQVGVIGLGDHADRSHLRHLVSMPELCKITALGDIDESRIRRVQTRYALSAEGFSDWMQLESSKDVDAVFVMTPDRFHTVQLAGAVALGKHVFCEKPLASTDEEYELLAGALVSAEQNEIVVSTCHPRRFDPPFITAKEYLDDRSKLVNDFGSVADELGEVTDFEFNFDYHKPSKHGLHDSLMFDHLNHEIDLMHFLFGKSGIASAAKNYDNETDFNVTGMRRDGIRFSFTGARHREEQIYPEDMVIRFENGSLWMDMHKGKAILDSDNRSFERHDIRYITDYLERFKKINQHFLKSIMRLETPYISTEEMLINTRVAIDLKE
jgi:predicted dehydrogenase